LDDDSTVLFTIANTGTPLTEERIDALNQFLREQHADENFGIGIRNVYDRIQLAYGKEFGIRFKASDAQTTVVEVRIPFKTKKEDGDE
jgi:two-component system sensor histidine kinase YesM